MFKKFLKVLLSLGLAFILLSQLAHVSPVSAVPQHCGLINISGQAILQTETSNIDVENLKTSLRNIKDRLGIKTTFQLMSPSSTQNDWQTFLNTVAGEGMQAGITFFQASDTPNCSGGTCTLNAIERNFLTAMKDHPALFALSIVDEPFEDITAAEMRSLYTDAKAAAPNVKMMVGFSKEVMFGEQDSITQDFSSGMCDFCMISALEYKNNFFDAQTIRDTHSISRRVIKRECPTCTIWSSIQAFGSSTGGTHTMPSPEILQQIIDIVLDNQYENDGHLSAVLWQNWREISLNQENNNFTLSDTGYQSHIDKLKAMKAQAATNCIRGDVNGDEKVDGADYRQVLSDFGRTDTTSSDINGDKKVNIFDLNTVVGNKTN